MNAFAGLLASRWFASRWFVLTAMAIPLSFVLAWHLGDGGPFTAVATVGLGGGWAHNAVGKMKGDAPAQDDAPIDKPHEWADGDPQDGVL